ncbi:hypothetical protein C8Q78DRAFT_1045187, partial [Trametes maxima]
MFWRVWEWWHGERRALSVVVVVVDVVAVVGQPALLVVGHSDLPQPRPSPLLFRSFLPLSLKQLLGLLCVSLTPP